MDDRAGCGVIPGPVTLAREYSVDELSLEGNEANGRGFVANRIANARFERDVMPHLDSAYNLARWLSGNEDDAADIVQESFVKAFRALDTLVSNNPKPWLLSIVRNTTLTHLKRSNPNGRRLDLGDEMEMLEWDGPTPEESALLQMDREMLSSFINELPTEFREVVVLRELEGLSYKEISEVTRKPIGTVMSRLSRARTRMQQRASDRKVEEWHLGM
jgi:RNA polymerase sigma-70 factor (ECF subfamily)